MRDNRRVEEEWGRLDREKRESMEVTLRVDAELFPIVAGERLDRPGEVVIRWEMIFLLPHTRISF